MEETGRQAATGIPFGQETGRQAMSIRRPEYVDFYFSIIKKTPYSLQDITDRIQNGTITKEVVEKLKQERDKDELKEGSRKRFFTNFNLLVNMLYTESENDAESRRILESVGFFPDSSIVEDDGFVLKGGIRRRKRSLRKRSLRKKRKSTRRKRSSRKK